MKTESERFEIRIEVQSVDIDMQNRVNNVVYLRWVQDVATAHWSAIAPQEDQEKLVWVVRRHEIDYKRPALRDDTILARTWIGKASRFAFDRHTEIVRALDGKILAVARTVWCPVDRNSGRPTEVSHKIRSLFSVIE
ncbi:MAG: acyl-CoA thioesterase [Chlorobium sp.]|jgi:acyl-CoA thioester hydrolase|nr:acyl-CoA thioesterase [Chlorobium sp.]